MNGRIPKHFEFDTKLVQDICKLIGKHLTEKELISNIFKFRQYKYSNFAHIYKALQELVEFVYCKYKRIARIVAKQSVGSTRYLMCTAEQVCCA